MLIDLSQLIGLTWQCHFHAEPIVEPGNIQMRMIDADNLIEAKERLTELNGVLSRRHLIDAGEKRNREDIFQQVLIARIQQASAGRRQPKHVNGTKVVLILVEMLRQRAQIAALLGFVVDFEQAAKERGNQS